MITTIKYELRNLTVVIYIAFYNQEDIYIGGIFNDVITPIIDIAIGPALTTYLQIYLNLGLFKSVGLLDYVNAYGVDIPNIKLVNIPYELS